MTISENLDFTVKYCKRHNKDDLDTYPSHLRQKFLHLVLILKQVKFRYCEKAKKIRKNLPLFLKSTGASSPPTQPRQLPWLIFEIIINYKKWPKQPGRFEGKKFFIFLPTKKFPFLQNWKNKYYSTKQKNSLNTLGLLCRVEKNVLKITWKNLLWYPGSSSEDPGCLRTEFRGD